MIIEEAKRSMHDAVIPKCRESDSGKIEVIARNQVGEAYATTSLTVEERKDDYRSVLKHNVKPFFDEEQHQQSMKRQEMYSEQRKETMNKQVSSLHHSQLAQLSQQTKTETTAVSQ